MLVVLVSFQNGSDAQGPHSYSPDVPSHASMDRSELEIITTMHTVITEIRYCLRPLISCLRGLGAFLRPIRA